MKNCAQCLWKTRLEDQRTTKADSPQVSVLRLPSFAKGVNHEMPQLFI